VIVGNANITFLNSGETCRQDVAIVNKDHIVSAFAVE